MLVWNDKTRKLVEEGKLVVVGIAQEQHRNRCRLFAQWHKMDWPILYDPINLMRVRGVPIETAIDEYGIVRSTKPDLNTLAEEFVNKSFKGDAKGASSKPLSATKPDLKVLRQHVEKSPSGDPWRKLADAIVLWAGVSRIDEAIGAYHKAIELNPDDGDSHFRLGVCYRMRYESEDGKGSDFQAAVDSWTKARKIDPNQYIWRRRIEQYGPRLSKPYPFYDWIERAGSEIRARGDEPVEIRVLPGGSEIAGPAKEFNGNAGKAKSPDPKGRIIRDVNGLVQAEVTVVPQRIKPGQSVRVYVTLRPDQEQKVHWNNEAPALKFWVDKPDGWEISPQLMTAPQGAKAESKEPRQLEFEAYAGPNAGGTVKLTAYALYYVCEDTNGICFYLRNDIPVEVTVQE